MYLQSVKTIEESHTIGLLTIQIAKYKIYNADENKTAREDKIIFFI